MSVKGLERSEAQAKALQKRLNSILLKQKKEVQAEIDKIEYLLADRQALTAWKSSPAGAERIQRILQQLNEVETLYLEAGDSTAAQIFKNRMQKQLQQTLTNLKANQLEVQLQTAKFKAQAQGEILKGLNDVQNEGILTEMYNQARQSGGFLSNFGKAYMQDIVTLETKAAGSKTLGEYMNNLYTTYEQGLKNVFVKGIVRGDSYKAMQENLMKATKITAGKAKILVNTEANAIFNDGVKQTIEKNPLVKGYRFRAVLDSRTSKICQEHDGEYIPKDDIQPGVNYPPLHPNCRSTVTIVLQDEDEKKDTIQRYTKNESNQWEKVPVGMNYQEFKDKFGFADNKTPRRYTAATRAIGRDSMSRITPTTYKGYVKPSVAATKNIDRMLEAYIDNDTEFLSKVKENTGLSQVDKALFRQAQAETGFDGLPLKLDAKSFEQQIEKNSYKRLYRQFSGEDTAEEFLNGVMPFGNGKSNYGVGTYTFEAEPDEALYGKTSLEMALKSDDSKILKALSTTDSQFDIAMARTGDERINDILRKVPQAKRREVISLAAVQYGYDAIEVTSPIQGKYMLILNRTAVIVKGD